MRIVVATLALLLAGIRTTICPSVSGPEAAEVDATRPVPASLTRPPLSVVRCVTGSLICGGINAAALGVVACTRRRPLSSADRDANGAGSLGEAVARLRLKRGKAPG